MGKNLGQFPAILLEYEKLILSEEVTTSGLDVASPLRPFRALRQPVYVTGCRRAFSLLRQCVGLYVPHEFPLLKNNVFLQKL